MRVIVIGGTGHIGTYLIPRLVAAGHEVVSITRGNQQPYQADKTWDVVEKVYRDREREDRAGRFGGFVHDLRPEIVIDLVCYTEESARQIVDAVRNQVQMFIHCGTIWVHGPSVEVPTTEAQPRWPFGNYGIQKAAIERYLLQEAHLNHFPATILHPGHIVGQGWAPLNPAGNFNIAIFQKLANGEEILIPNLGMETVHHVHADDVAQAFTQAIAHFSTAIGESFHVVSPAAVTLRGYAETVAAWFGQPSKLRFLPWEEWRLSEDDQDAAFTWDHIAHSPNCSIAKARRLIDYQPRFSSFQAVRESLNDLILRGVIKI